jgi:mitosis inhibitor protein kinase SWE1
MDDEEMFFAGEGSSSFVLNVTRNTPSPHAKPALPMKYKHRDSLLVSDDDEMPSTGSSMGGNFLVPNASMSVSSIGSEDGLVTPGVALEGSSGWPFVDGVDGITHPYSHEPVDVDAFIMKTLATAFKGSNMPKKIPGTPVKKARISYFGNDRPWQSAVASKVGLKEDCEFKQKPPRKSMPAAFPPIGTKATKLIHERQRSDTDTEDEDEDSPSTRRVKYVGLGLGLPPPHGPSAIPRNRWLMRRSSSGAFSSGGESTSLSNTPTRAKGIGQ